MDAVVYVSFIVIIRERTHSAEIINVFKIEVVVYCKIPIVFFGSIYSCKVDTNLGILEDIFLHTNDAKKWIPILLIVYRSQYPKRISSGFSRNLCRNFRIADAS